MAEFVETDHAIFSLQSHPDKCLIITWHTLFFIWLHRSKEFERQLLEPCEEDLLNLDENENSESKEEDISLEQRYLVHTGLIAGFSLIICFFKSSLSNIIEAFWCFKLDYGCQLKWNRLEFEYMCIHDTSSYVEFW